MAGRIKAKAKRSFADVVKSMGLLDDKAVEEPATTDDYMEQDMEDEPAPGAKQRYWKARRHAAQQAGMEDDVAECDLALAALAAQAKASRPWEARLQAASQRHARALAGLEQAKKDREAAEAVLQALQEAEVAAAEVEQVAAQDLAKIKAEVAVEPVRQQGVGEEPTLEGLIAKLVALARQSGLDTQALACMVAELPGAGVGASVQPGQQVVAHGTGPALASAPVGWASPQSPTQVIPAAQGTPLAAAFQAGQRRGGGGLDRQQGDSHGRGDGLERSRSPVRELVLGGGNEAGN